MDEVEAVDVGEQLTPPNAANEDDVAVPPSRVPEEIDDLYCPICMAPWTNGGDHQVCCLPCGHLYGACCIKKWLQNSVGPKTCPQCNSKCSLKDVRVMYASQIVVVDHELQKKVESLVEKCASLEKEILRMANTTGQVSLSRVSSFQSNHACDCGVESPLRVSYTSRNPGHKFYGCGNYSRVFGRRCQYFQWYDEEHTSNSLVMSVESQEINNRLMRELDDAKREIRMMQVCLSSTLLALVLIAVVCCAMF